MISLSFMHQNSFTFKKSIGKYPFTDIWWTGSDDHERTMNNSAYYPFSVSYHAPTINRGIGVFSSHYTALTITYKWVLWICFHQVQSFYTYFGLSPQTCWFQLGICQAISQNTVPWQRVKGCRMGRSDKVSLWYGSLLINTRFRFFILK